MADHPIHRLIVLKTTSGDQTNDNFIRFKTLLAQRPHHSCHRGSTGGLGKNPFGSREFSLRFPDFFIRYQIATPPRGTARLHSQIPINDAGDLQSTDGRGALHRTCLQRPFTKRTGNGVVAFGLHTFDPRAACQLALLLQRQEPLCRRDT